jgi:hypothetical protein
MTDYDRILDLTARWEQAMRERDEARWAATVFRNDEMKCSEYGEEDCPLCKANKLIDQWEKDL